MSRPGYHVSLPPGTITGFGWSGTVHLRRIGETEALCGCLLLAGYLRAGDSLDDVTCGDCLTGSRQP